MNIVLVSIGNYQDFIIDNIRNLIRLKHENIYVIINETFKEKFAEFAPSVFGSVGGEKNPSPVKLVFVENLNDNFHYYDRTTTDKTFRGGFWALTTLRFFYLYAFMEKYSVENVLHIENDVVLYYNANELLGCIDRNQIYVPFHSFNINVADIIYIPRATIFRHLVENWNMDAIDMHIFRYFKQMFPAIINMFPICKSVDGFNEEQRAMCMNYPHFNKIFDAAALGQYLGGIDSRNVDAGVNTVGFINKECVIKFNRWRFVWKPVEEGEVLAEGTETGVFKRPFLVFENGEEIPIFNMHVHSKNLVQFIGGAGF
jgi:hypothetical protein